MASANPFDLLGDCDNNDPFLLIATNQKKAEKSALPPPSSLAKKTLIPTQPTVNPPAKLPSKPLPPSQAVRETKGEERGGSRRSGGGRHRFSGRDNYSDTENNNVLENGFTRRFGASEDGEIEKPSDGGRGYGCGPRNGHHGGRGFGRTGGCSNGEVEDGNHSIRRQFDRHSMTGRGNEVKREGYGRGNWGTLTDQGQTEKPAGFPNCAATYSTIEERAAGEEDGVATEKEDNTLNETEEKEPEAKEMTLDEYEKLLEEKKAALQAIQKTEERKVDVDKEFGSMQLLSAKKSNDEIFIKLGSEKELPKKKDNGDKEELAKKAVSINEFLRPAEGGRNSNPGGRGRGGCGSRGGFGGSSMMHAAAPSIEDHGQFPTLSAN